MHIFGTSSVLLPSLLAVGCTKTVVGNLNSNNGIIADTHTMYLESPAFKNGESIPSKYTCDGQSINPPLTFSAVPERTKSLAILVHDPDVPKDLKPDGMFDHWVLYNIPPEALTIPENDPTIGVAGKNGSGETGYTGPCPPDKEHRYFFKAYALDTELAFPTPPTRAEVEAAMKGHALTEAELMGKYNKQK